MTRADDLTPTAAAQLLSDDQAVLIDVREADEWQQGHAEKSLHIPLGELDAGQVDASKVVITVCRSGRRSSQAADQLGETHTVHNVAGGLGAWVESGLPLVRDDGAPGAIK